MALEHCLGYGREFTGAGYGSWPAYGNPKFYSGGIEKFR